MVELSAWAKGEFSSTNSAHAAEIKIQGFIASAVAHNGGVVSMRGCVEAGVGHVQPLVRGEFEAGDGTSHASVERRGRGAAAHGNADGATVPHGCTNLEHGPIRDFAR